MCSVLFFLLIRRDRYTFLSSMSIVPVGNGSAVPCGSPVLPFNTTLLTTPPGVTFVNGLNTGLSGGAIAGIVIAVLVAVAVAIVVALYLAKRATSDAAAKPDIPYNSL